MTRVEMLEAVIDYRERIKRAARAEDAGLLAQLDTMELRLIDGDVPTAEFEQFELQWVAAIAELMGDIRRRSAHIMLAFEDMERKDPQVFAHDETVRKQLHWWREEGGREQFLGNIPLAERRTLEAMARKWREKNP